MGGGPDLQIDLLGHVLGILRAAQDGQGQGVHRPLCLAVQLLQGGHVSASHPGQQSFIHFSRKLLPPGHPFHGHIQEHGLSSSA